MRRIFLTGVACMIVALTFWAVTREQHCEARWQPVLLDDTALLDVADTLPAEWLAGAPGVRVGEFSLDADAKSIHMVGIGTWLRLPSITVEPNQKYCVSVRAIADSRSATAVRTRWWWYAGDTVIAERTSPWQPVRAWQGDTDTLPWSLVAATDRAPAHATSVRIQIEPASDDRLYLDLFRVRATRVGGKLQDVHAHQDARVHVRPWPAGYNAAVSFSYDWETAMGGLVHSRSVDDPNAGIDPMIRSMRMREGLTTTLALFAPYNFPATYYVNGYNFLDDNLCQATFMDNPTFAWASQANGWRGDTWTRQPWFSLDPYGTYHDNPGWYFGDLINPVRNAGHDLQSHTFSHFYGGYASEAEWMADLAAWNAVAATKSVAPATSLAFPWSSSAGVSYQVWSRIAEAGITSLTRTSWNPKLPQYHIVSASEARCRPLPGHEQIMVCPDYYLTVARADGALALLADIRTRDGMIDFWAHTEEVISPEQIAAWQRVVDTVASTGDVWVAPLVDIARRQQLIDQLHTTFDATQNTVIVRNPASVAIQQVVIQLPDGYSDRSTGAAQVTLDLTAGAVAKIRVTADE